MSAGEKPLAPAGAGPAGAPPAETGLLGLTRVAYGCQSLADIVAREPRLLEEGTGGAGASVRASVRLDTARAPRRDLAGGSLFWIVRHTLVARQPILFVRETGTPERPRAEIHLQPGPIAVVPRHLQAHQGWRYLPQALWPDDMDGSSNSLPLPPELAARLADLSLL